MDVATATGAVAVAIDDAADDVVVVAAKRKMNIESHTKRC